MSADTVDLIGPEYGEYTAERDREGAERERAWALDRRR